MIFGVLKDIKIGENRVICTPVEIASIAAAGHTVLVQAGAGAGSGFADEAYEKAGARIVETAQEMFDAVTRRAGDADFIFKAAAVADYTPAEVASEKLKKHDGEFSIPLRRTQDILQYLGDHRRDGQVLCGFSMETRDLLENSAAKLEKKHVDMICANNLKVAGAGFGTDTNVITLITARGATELPLQSKDSAANAILDAALALANEG